MEVNTTGAYSPDIVYGQLTSPFRPVNVKINAHTPYDKESETENAAVSMKNFIGKPVTFKYAQGNEDEYQFGIDSGYKPSSVDTGVEVPEFPPKNVKSFSASAVSSNKDIVKGALKSGYTYDQALVMTKAQKAYSSSVGITKDPISALSSREFHVV